MGAASRPDGSPDRQCRELAAVPGLHPAPMGYSIKGQVLCKERCHCRYCFVLGMANHLECAVLSRGKKKKIIVKAF